MSVYERYGILKDKNNKCVDCGNFTPFLYNGCYYCREHLPVAQGMVYG